MVAFGAILLIFAAFIGFIMEAYKKCIRDDKAGVWEIRGVAFLFSAFYGFVTWAIVSKDSLPEGVAYTPWLIVLFASLIYILQLPACMKVWKPMLKRYLEGKADG